MRAEPEWQIQSPDPARLAELEAGAIGRGLSPLVTRLLCQRGFTATDDLERFLFPRLRDLADPFLLPQMDEAVARILAAADQRETVVLYGDYDVDGVTSLMLLKTILAAYGIEATPFLPHRIGEGYGISHEGLTRCLAECDPDLLIAVDCGTSSADEIRWLREQAIDVIVVDHHECPPEARPECVALVNPKAYDERGFDYLCSVGLVFKLGHALLKRRPVEGFDLRETMDVVAIGTVADIVPLVDENRLLVRRGLQQLERTTRPGLRELKRVASVNGRIGAADVGFRLGPRLNASGRVDTAQSSLDLLLTTCPDEARQLAENLDLRNRERQALERKALREAEAALHGDFAPDRDACIVLGSEEWHPGVVGIVASRLMRAYHRPTFVVAFDESGLGKGSGRSVPGLSLIEAIHACRGCLVNGGGHEMAAGISVERGRFEEFRALFRDVIAEMASGSDVLRPRLRIDAVALLDDLTLEMLDSYELLQPFGNANPEPLFMSAGVVPAGEPRVLRDRHLKLRLRQGTAVRDAIYFGGGDAVLPPPPWDVAYHVHRNFYRGQESVQITIQALRAAAAA